MVIFAEIEEAHDDDKLSDKVGTSIAGHNIENKLHEQKNSNAWDPTSFSVAQSPDKIVWGFGYHIIKHCFLKLV